jgi:hypothetical protein
MDKKTKTFALIGLGVAGVGAAYVLSKGKTSDSSQQSQDSSGSPATVPIPALLAQSSLRPANNAISSNPIPANTQTTTTPTTTGGLQSFYDKAGLRAYTANDPNYEQYKGSYDKLLDLGNGSLLTVPTYVTDKTTLLKHLSIVQSQYSSDAAYSSLLNTKIAQVNTL